jgi:hypothetical protein
MGAPAFDPNDFEDVDPADFEDVGGEEISDQGPPLDYA